MLGLAIYSTNDSSLAWLPIAFVAPLLWAAITALDLYFVHGPYQDEWDGTLISGSFQLLPWVLVPLGLVGFTLPAHEVVLLALCGGATFLAAIFFYLRAMFRFADAAMIHIMWNAAVLVVPCLCLDLVRGKAGADSLHRHRPGVCRHVGFRRPARRTARGLPSSGWSDDLGSDAHVRLDGLAERRLPDGWRSIPRRVPGVHSWGRSSNIGDHRIQRDVDGGKNPSILQLQNPAAVDVRHRRMLGGCRHRVFATGD